MNQNPNDCYGTFQQQCPFNGVEEVHREYYDTAGNYHWFGTMTGHHIVKLQVRNRHDSTSCLQSENTRV